LIDKDSICTKAHQLMGFFIFSQTSHADNSLGAITKHYLHQKRTSNNSHLRSCLNFLQIFLSRRLLLIVVDSLSDFLAILNDFIRQIACYLSHKIVLTISKIHLK
jgi:hypothetical protein